MGTLRFLRGDEISKGEGAEEFAHGATGFESLPANGVVARKNRELMDSAVGAKNGPTGVADAFENLREPLTAVERLIVLAMGVAEASVQLVEAHKIGVVGSGQKEFALGTGDAMHFGKGGGSIGQVLDGLAGDDHVKRVRSERKILRVALGEGGKWTRGRRGNLGVRDAQSSDGEVASDDAGAGELKFAYEAATAAGDFQNVKAGDGPEIFAHYGVPGAGGVFVLRIGVVEALMPDIVGGLEGHGRAAPGRAAELNAVGNGALHALEEEEAAD